MGKTVDHRSGHRGRVKERFLREGLDIFAEYEILELLLFYAVPRKDTKGMAHALMDAFQSLYAVLTAEAEALCTVPGIGMHTARFLKEVFSFAEFVIKKEVQPEPFCSEEDIGVYFVDFFRKNPDITVAAMFVNNRHAPIQILPLGRQGDGFELTSVRVPALLGDAYPLNAPGLILAYQKKEGIPIPSASVMEYIRNLESDFYNIGIKLHEIVYVVGTQYNYVLQFMAGAQCRTAVSAVASDAAPYLPLPVVDRVAVEERLNKFLLTFLNEGEIEPLTGKLLSIYPSFAILLSVPYETLVQRDGIPPSLALLLKMLKETYGRAMLSRTLMQRQGLCQVDKLGRVFADYIGGRSEEVLALATFDGKKRLINISLNGVGTVNANLFALRSLLQEAIRVKAAYVAIAHNHPLGACVPSEQDFKATRDAKRLFEGARISFLEHYIVNERNYFPLASATGEFGETSAPFFYEK